MGTAPDPLTKILTLSTWADTARRSRLRPTSTYSRAAWLPVLGADAWALWGSAAQLLRHYPTVTWWVDHVAASHGLASVGDVDRCLARLGWFRLASQASGTHWQVRTDCPALPADLLDRAAPTVQRLHRRTFPGALLDTATAGQAR